VSPRLRKPFLFEGVGGLLFGEFFRHEPGGLGFVEVFFLPNQKKKKKTHKLQTPHHVSQCSPQDDFSTARLPSYGEKILEPFPLLGVSFCPDSNFGLHSQPFSPFFFLNGSWVIIGLKIPLPPLPRVKLLPLLSHPLSSPLRFP